MAHEFVKDIIDPEDRTVGPRMISLFAGGTLLLTSVLARAFFSSLFYPDILSMVSAILLGAPLVWQALMDLYKGRTEMNELAALGVLAAFVAGRYVTAGSISFFMVISSMIENRSAMGARKSIESLIRLTPRMAHKIEDGEETEVDAASLCPGDVVRVRPGDSIPGDGRVISGCSAVDEASITGESMPVEKTEGEEVFAGTINVSGAMDICITVVGDDTTLSKVQHLILQAEQSRTPVMRAIDRYAGWYAPTIIAIAAVVLFFTRDVTRTISMLIIACPCTIILSGPTAVVAALSAAARLGVLIKNIADLEMARKLTAVIFDKTGTLTTGALCVSRVSPVAGMEEERLISLAAMVERNSTHPVAKAVMARAADDGLELPVGVENFEEVPGRGVRGIVDGNVIMVGRARWLSEHGVDISAVDLSDAEGLSVLHVTWNGSIVGWIGLEDRTRPDAATAMQALREGGMEKIFMVTGDRWPVARRVAEELHCTDVKAEVLPEDKMEVVSRLKAQGHRVAVIGDGVNDAPALAAGDISIAMGAAGSDVAISSASIALMNNELDRIPFLMDLSKNTMKVIRQNLIFAAAGILGLLAMSAAGMIHPIFAVLLHTGSAFVIIFNSARLVRQGEHLERAVTVPSGTFISGAVPVEAAEGEDYE